MAEETIPAAAENPGDLFNQRVAKVQELEAAGIAPYGQAYPDVQMISDVRGLFAKPDDDGTEALDAAKWTDDKCTSLLLP